MIIRNLIAKKGKIYNIFFCSFVIAVQDCHGVVYEMVIKQRAIWNRYYKRTKQNVIYVIIINLKNINMKHQLANINLRKQLQTAPKERDKLQQQILKI